MKNKLLVILALILCFSMIFVLASCGGDDTDTDTTQNTNNQNKPEDDDETKDSEKESEVESEKESETESNTESETDSDDENECVHAEQNPLFWQNLPAIKMVLPLQNVKHVVKS